MTAVTGTILNALGVDPVTIMEVLGHTQMSLFHRYVHAATPQAMRRMGDAFRGTPETSSRPETETTTETTDTRAARTHRCRRIK